MSLAAYIVSETFENSASQYNTLTSKVSNNAPWVFNVF